MDEDKEYIHELEYEVEEYKHLIYCIYKNLPNYGNLYFDNHDTCKLAGQIIRELQNYEVKKKDKN